MSLTRIMNTFYPKTSSRDDNPEENWPDPMPLRNDLHPVVPLHSSNFPAPYQEWVLDVSERMQCPADYIAVAAIVATAAVIGTGCGIKPKQHDDWLVIPN